MALVMTLDGPNEILEVGIEAFAKQHGWVEENGKTYLEFSRDVLASFIKETIKAYNANRAAIAAAEAAKANTDVVFAPAVLTAEFI